jgi:alkylresorcinol/alkylpyrone synthase
VTTALPPYYATQSEIVEFLGQQKIMKPAQFERFKRFMESVQVKGRHLSVPLHDYLNITNSFAKKNEAWLKTSMNLLEKAVGELLEQANLEAKNISLLMSTSITGLTIPSLEARLMNKFAFKASTKRVPLFGLGCLAGAAGIARAHDYLKAYPEEAVIFFSSELCSLTVQLTDVSVANMISTSLFGDGAAAVLLVGESHPLKNKCKLKILETQSSFYPETEEIMGWDIVDQGFKIILSSGVPELVQKYVPSDLTRILNKRKMTQRDLEFFVSHPGGPKVLEAMELALELKQNELKSSWKSLSEIGNLSSASVLFILKETIENLKQERFGLMTAMGPGFCSEMLILENVHL